MYVRGQPFINQPPTTMSYSSILTKVFLFFLYCCCCSFSAIPATHSPPQKVPPSKTKRQLRQQKHQQKKRLRIQKRLSKRLEQPQKNHATYNIAGFSVIAGAYVVWIAGTLAILSTIGMGGLVTVLLIAILIALIGVVLCIVGLIGHKKAEKPRIGFSIAGLIMAGIPALFMLVGLLFVILGII